MTQEEKEPLLLCKLKRGDKFKYVDEKTGQIGNVTYIKSKPYTDGYGVKCYATTLYDPGTLRDGIFTGYAFADTVVLKID